MVSVRTFAYNENNGRRRKVTGINRQSFISHDDAFHLIRYQVIEIKSVNNTFNRVVKMGETIIYSYFKP